LATKEKERCGRDDHKDHHYGHDCRITATTTIIRHKLHPPFSCTDDSLLVRDVSVQGGK
jgi:hypothetical protein